jgi:sugar phosphate permease
MLSTIILPLTLVPVIEWLGWRGMFYFLGVLGALISIPLIWKFVYDAPAKHPAITAGEIKYIESGMEQDEQAVEGSIWKQMKPIAQDRKYWFAQMGGILNNFVTYGLLMWFPTYFTQARGVEFTDLKYAVSIPYISGVLGIVVVALISDRTQRRVLIAGLGSFMTAVSAYFACTVPTIPASIALFSAAVFFQMGYTTNEFAIVQRILPKNRVGTGTGIYNGLAILIGGGLGPVITGQVIAYTGSLTYGILTVVLYAILAGTNMLIFSRFLKF